MRHAGANCVSGLEERSVDTLRLLTQSRIEISSWDMSDFWRGYQGPVEGAEFMFSHDSIQSESDISDADHLFPLLATALRKYGAKPSEWERFLRFILRRNADLHSPVSRMGKVYHHSGVNTLCKITEYGTPLDELFSKTETPFEGAVAADRWLQILSSEGYDVVTYLEKEQALHAAQMQLTYPYRRK